MCIYIYIYMYVCMYVCIYIYIYIYIYMFGGGAKQILSRVARRNRPKAPKAAAEFCFDVETSIPNKVFASSLVSLRLFSMFKYNL